MIIRTLALTAVLSLATLPAVAQTGGQTTTAPAQDGSSTSSSSDATADELDQMIADLATEAIQCVAVADVETPAHADKAADLAKMRAEAVSEFKLFTDYSDDDLAALLPDLTQSYKDEVANGNVKADEWIDGCLADFKPEDAPSA